MEREWITQQSTNLDKEMHLLVYGNAGWPVIVFETQDSMCNSFEDFGMIDTLSDFIEEGRIQLFCVDSVDAESWSNRERSRHRRAARQEAYFRYVCEELLPLVHERNDSDLRPLAVGCSMGALHALLCVLRRPDLFEGCIAMSGVYDAALFYGDWMNDDLYLNSPVTFLPNMPTDHPYIELYNQRQIVLCVGQGAWEDEGVRTQRIVDEQFRAKGIHAWCDYWGFDVNHDWPWWKQQIRYFLPIVLGNIEGKET